jgi:membrane protein
MVRMDIANVALPPNPDSASGWRQTGNVNNAPLRATYDRWAPVVRRTVIDLWENSATEWAAALAFYAVLSLFPLALAGSALAAYFVQPDWATDRLTGLLSGIVPTGVVDVDAVVSAALAERRRVGLFAIVTWIVAGRRVFGALVTALDQVSDVDERHERFIRRILVELVLLVGLSLLFLLSFSARPLIDLLFGGTETANVARTDGISFIISIFRFVLIVTAFVAIYAIVPYGKRQPKPVLIGATVAAGLFVLARTFFLMVLDRIWDNFSLIYGPLAFAAVLLLWAWYVSLVVLFGGSLASHAKVMVVEGHSAAHAERQHVSRKRDAS